MIKLKSNTLEDIWFCSDPHYNHKNICRGVSSWNDENHTRNFSTLEEMNQTLVNNINKVVKKDDILFCLGDWSFGGINSILEFRKQINCKRIYLVLGNHDHHVEKNKILPNGDYKTVTVKAKEAFTWVGHYLEVKINDENFVLCHYPMVSWNNLSRQSIMLHGHEHLKGDARFVSGGKQMDVGFDGSPEFRPYSLREILTIMEERPVKTLLTYTHHEINR